MAASAISLWRAFGAVMSTRSISGSSTSARQSPVAVREAERRGGLRGELVGPVGDGVQHELVGQVEDALRGGEAEDMGLAHEAGADQADLQRRLVSCHGRELRSPPAPGRCGRRRNRARSAPRTTAMRSAHSAVSPAMCGDRITWSMREERVVRRRRLVLEDVEPGRGEPALAQRRDQRRLVDHAAARGVDENGGRLHHRELGRADQRPVGLRHVDGDDVRPGKPARPGPRPARPRPPASRAPRGTGSKARISMPKPAAMRARCRPLRPNPTMSSRLPAELALLEPVAPVPRAGAHRAVGAERALRRRQQQHHRLLGDRRPS